jgi:hypothetical protein
VRRSSWERLPVLIALAAFAAPLLAHGLIGTTMRYSGDDYCYAGLFRRHGFLETLRSTYTGPAPFNGNRFSLTGFSGLADAIGPFASAALPGLILLLWIGGLTFLLTQLRPFLAVPLAGPANLLLAEVLAFSALAATPDLVQSLYWRSAMLPYLAPIVVFTFVLGLMMRHSIRQRLTPAARASIFVLSLIAAGFSETAAALQLTGLGLLVLAALFSRALLADRAPATFPVIATALAGSMVGTLLLALAPTNWPLLQGLRPTADLASILPMAVKNTYLFAYGFVFRHSAAVLVAFLVGIGLSLQTLRSPSASKPATPVRLLSSGLAIGVAATTLVLVGMLPSATIQSSYPPGRALIGATFASICAVVAFGWMTGVLGSRLAGKDPRLALVAAGLLLVLTCAFPLVSARESIRQFPTYLRWARAWDARDLEIRTARELGQISVEVMLFDKIIPEVAELQPDPDYWYNNCAEWYYDLDRLSANLPGWDT